MWFEMKKIWAEEKCGWSNKTEGEKWDVCNAEKKSIRHHKRDVKRKELEENEKILLRVK